MTFCLKKTINIGKFKHNINAAMITTIRAKTLLSPVKPGADNWFGLRYNLNLYRGCQHGCIYCGITLMPVLPFLTDQPGNMEKLVQMAKESGARYILAVMGMTIREGQREYFYGQLDRKFPGVKERYIKSFGLQYSCNAPNHRKLWHVYSQACQSLSMPQHMEFYKNSSAEQMKMF